MSVRRRRYLLYACLVVIFGPSLFLSWRTYQLADRITAIESFDSVAAVDCPAVDRALAATWSDASARQFTPEQRAACAPGAAGAQVSGAERAAAPCSVDEDEDAIGDTFGVFTGHVDDACGLRETALMTFRTTVALTLLAVVLAVMTLRPEL
jgi:hypothetical protein